MCIIHLRPTARSSSPEQPIIVPSRPITRGAPPPPPQPTSVPAPPLSRRSYPQPRSSPRTSSGPTHELQRLSIHSREEWEALQNRQKQQPPPAAADDLIERSHQPSSPRTSTTRTPIRRGGDYTYGSAPVPTSPSRSRSPHPRTEEGQEVVALRPTGGHKRSVSSVVINAPDGTLTTRPQYSKQARSSSMSLGPPNQSHSRRASLNRGTTTGRSSAGNVSINKEERYGMDPRHSGRSFRERIVVVEEGGRRRREYVRREG